MMATLARQRAVCAKMRPTSLARLKAKAKGGFTPRV